LVGHVASVSTPCKPLTSETNGSFVTDRRTSSPGVVSPYEDTGSARMIEVTDVRHRTTCLDILGCTALRA